MFPMLDPDQGCIQAASSLLPAAASANQHVMAASARVWLVVPLLQQRLLMFPGNWDAL
jgi:hypothetical protein